MVRQIGFMQNTHLMTGSRARALKFLQN